MDELGAKASFFASNFSFKKYSTALTSWFVVRSMVFIRSASATEKFTYQLLSSSAEISEALSIIPVSNNAIKYSTSMSTRYRINPNSEKYACNGAVFAWYLPSIGEMVERGEKSIVLLKSKGTNFIRRCYVHEVHHLRKFLSRSMPSVVL